MMGHAPLEWNVVTAGKWNSAIFTPKFIKTEVTKTGAGNLEIFLPAESSNFIFFRDQDYKIEPRPDRLIIEPVQPNLVNLKNAMTYMSNAIQSLPKTPLTACGINSRFVIPGENTIPNELLKGKTLTTIEGKLKEVHSLDVSSWELGCGLLFKSGDLNMKILGAANETRFLFNFHLGTSNTENILEWLKIDPQDLVAIANTTINTFTEN